MKLQINSQKNQKTKKQEQKNRQIHKCMGIKQCSFKKPMGQIGNHKGI